MNFLTHLCHFSTCSQNLLPLSSLSECCLSWQLLLLILFISARFLFKISCLSSFYYLYCCSMLAHLFLSVHFAAVCLPCAQKFRFAFDETHRSSLATFRNNSCAFSCSSRSLLLPLRIFPYSPLCQPSPLYTFCASTASPLLAFCAALNCFFRFRTLSVCVLRNLRLGCVCR